MSNSNSAFEACHVEQNCFEHSKTVAAQHFPSNESVQQQFLPTGSQQHLNYRQRLGGNGGCNVTRPWLYFDYLLRTQFTWESVKLEYTLPWHFYKKETTISFPFPQIFETPLQWPRQLDICWWPPNSSSSSFQWVYSGWLATPPSVRDCLHAGPNIDTSRVSHTTQCHITETPISQSATLLRHPYHTVLHYCDTNTTQYLTACTHQHQVNTELCSSLSRALWSHTVESTVWSPRGPILISAGSPAPFLATF